MKIVFQFRLTTIKVLPILKLQINIAQRMCFFIVYYKGDIVSYLNLE